MAEIYYLSREEVELLRAMVREYKKRGGLFPTPPPSDLQTPDIYIAKVPEDGIPALEENGTGTTTDDVPGEAECEIYKIVEDLVGTGGPYMTPCGFTKTVYNLSTVVITDTYVPIKRDKFGKWIVSGTGTPECEETHDLDDPPGTGSGSALDGEEGGEQPIETEWSLEDGECASLLLEARNVYKEDGDEILYGFRRLIEITSDGRFKIIGQEQRYTVDVPEDCEGSAGTGEEEIDGGGP